MHLAQSLDDALATVAAVLGLDPETTRIHCEDPATTQACPGKNVTAASTRPVFGVVVWLPIRWQA